DQGGAGGQGPGCEGREGGGAVARGRARSRRRGGGPGCGQATGGGLPRPAQSLYAEVEPRLRPDGARALRAGGSRQRQGRPRAGGEERPRPGRARLWQTRRRPALRIMRTCKARSLLLALALLMPSAARAADAPFEPGRVYVGGDGVTIAIVPLKPKTDNKALGRVYGSGTVHDEKAILHHGEDGGGKVAYGTTYRGRDWITITVPTSPEARAIPIYLPGRRDVTVKYDEARTAELKTDDVFRAYQKQQADGSLKALAAFNRPEETAQHEKQLASDAGESFAKRCGYKLPVKINWTTFSDDDIKELSIASYCGEPVDAMARLCEDSAEAKRTITAAIKSFGCAMGPAMQLDIAGTTLNWTTSRSARNMGDFARKYLEKKL